jgi:uncharacterized flavoprotein (TIGR03862 family)
MHGSAFTAAVIGGGPAGLMAAEVLSQNGVAVDLFDAMPSVGRKFLLAGVGGMNITHAEAAEKFLSRFGARQPQIEILLRDFSVEALRAWAHSLGIDTFVGSSGRVFPTDMKAAPLLRAWLHRLRGCGVNIHTRHRWLGWGDNSLTLRFATPAGEITRRANAVVLALGGGSWAKLGSDGSWVSLLQQYGIDIAPLKPANCGFDIDWSAHFRERYAGQPLKSIIVTAVDNNGVPLSPDSTPTHLKGECVITQNGIEGGAIYALAAPLREQIISTGKAYLHIDLAPDRSLQNIVAALTKPRGSNSLANHLRKQLHIGGVKTGLLHEKVHAGSSEQADQQRFADPVALAQRIKALPLTLHNTRPLDEAISSAGGVRFAALDERQMLRELPGVFCAGEMLDWEAPTGGYLLTGCFASGRAAGEGVLAWRKSNVY